MKLKRRKLRLYEEQNGLCCLCGLPMTLDRGTARGHLPPEFATYEHVVPKSLGGTNDIGNIKLSHYKCNRARSVGTEHAPFPQENYAQ